MVKTDVQVFVEAMSRYVDSQKSLFGRALDAEEIIKLHAGSWLGQNVPAHLHDRVWGQTFGREVGQ